MVGDNPVALWDLSAALEFRKEYDGAMDCFRRIVKKDPEDAKGNNRFGRSLVGHGRVDEAVGYLRQAARLEPDEKQFHCDLASALLVQGNVEEALAEFHKTIAAGP